ncbi:hypothetical protein AGRA3207_002788 [Actinomadura graeca]|uniref:WD40-like Beta Propeller Repeat n=1 Tax=Actinomadura graeca TaxID=2750812 RepID=A0ABX8QWR0_9ACTN|nr:hypothetical protein [Actinomadura graeca]QXJ21882.1 hypothetical protein AGRA3207_002788 [Actinomadura graeca]
MKPEPPLEERLRDAYRAAADAYGPETVPPLRAQAGSGGPSPRRRLAPLAAVACVIMLVVAAVALDRAHDRTARPVETPSPALTTPGTRRPLPARPDGPRFMAVASGDTAGLVIRDTAGGRVTARLVPPRGDTFDDVAVAGDDRTFIVTTRAAEPGAGPARISVHRVALADDGTVATFTPLPRLAYTTELSDPDMAVSPDGTKIAFVAYRAHPDKARSTLEAGRMNIGRIEVVTIATGGRRTWTVPDMSRIGDLSWAGSTLAFTFTRLASPPRGLGVVAAGPTQIRTLDANGSGGDLLAGTVLLSRPETQRGDVAWLLPDGRSLVTNAGHPSVLRLYSVRTGRPIRDLATAPGREEPAEWAGLTADATGRHLLAVPSIGDLVHLDLATRRTAPLPSGAHDQPVPLSAW